MAKNEQNDNRAFWAVQIGSIVLILLCAFLKLIMGISTPDNQQYQERN